MTPQQGDALASSLILCAAHMLVLSGVFWPGLGVWPLAIVLYAGWMMVFSRFQR